MNLIYLVIHQLHNHKDNQLLYQIILIMDLNYKYEAHLKV